MKILLAGCGDIGQRLGMRLSSEHHCVGLRRNPQQNLGSIEFRKADLTDPESLLPLLMEGFDVLVATLTPDIYNEEGYTKAYMDTALAMAKAFDMSAVLPSLVIWVSSTGVYADNDGWSDESSVTHPETFSGQVLLSAETAIRQLPCDVCIVRFSGIYGDNRRGVLNSIVKGIGPSEFPKRWSNRIHIDDCVGSLDHLINRHILGLPLNDLYIASDCEPVLQYDLYQWVSRKLKRDITEVSDKIHRNCRLSNKGLLDSGYRFKFPTYREGYDALITHFIENE